MRLIRIKLGPETVERVRREIHTPPPSAVTSSSPPEDAERRASTIPPLESGDACSYVTSPRTQDPGREGGGDEKKTKTHKTKKAKTWYEKLGLRSKKKKA